jgi:hypothetical protein
MHDELDDEHLQSKNYNVLIRGASRQGTQGIMDTASKGTLEDEFGTSREEDVVQQILEKGSIIETEVRLDPLSRTAMDLRC